MKSIKHPVTKDRVKVVKDFTSQTVHQTVQKSAEIAVKAGSKIYTDSAKSYQALVVIERVGYTHEYVNHSQKEYARGFGVSWVSPCVST